MQWLFAESQPGGGTLLPNLSAMACSTTGRFSASGVPKSSFTVAAGYAGILKIILVASIWNPLAARLSRLLCGLPTNGRIFMAQVGLKPSLSFTPRDIGVLPMRLVTPVTASYYLVDTVLITGIQIACSLINAGGNLGSRVFRSPSMT